MTEPVRLPKIRAEKPFTTGAKDRSEKAGTAEKGENKTEGKTGASADTKKDTSAEGGLYFRSLRGLTVNLFKGCGTNHRLDQPHTW